MEKIRNFGHEPDFVSDPRFDPDVLTFYIPQLGKAITHCADQWITRADGWHQHPHEHGPAWLLRPYCGSRQAEMNGFNKVAQPSSRPYRLSGGMVLMAAENRAWTSGSTGLCLTLVLAGSFPRKLSPFQFVDGLIGLGTNPPPQFGQTFSSTLSTHLVQNVHS
jgi:hypothetical protein